MCMHFSQYVGDYSLPIKGCGESSLEGGQNTTVSRQRCHVPSQFPAKVKYVIEFIILLIIYTSWFVHEF